MRMPKIQKAAKRTRKYLSRKESILNAAAGVLNEKGLNGMTLSDVAAHFGIVRTGVAYYFSSKEELAAACFHRAIDAHRELFAKAAVGRTLEARLTILIREYFDFFRQVACGERHDISVFDDIRALADEGVIAAYIEMFRHARTAVNIEEVSSMDRATLNSRIHWLVQQLIWIRLWLPKCHPEDYERAAERTIEIMLNGLSASKYSSTVPRLELAKNPDVDDPREIFLRAATQLMNEVGYRGASVEAISARIALTKGSFYYHIDTKQDLMEICFMRTVEIVRNTQTAAKALAIDASTQLAATLISLVEHQLAGDAPLLRAATASVPEAIRRRVMIGYERNAVRFGAMVSDGIADGSIRPIDNAIAAQMLTGTVNGAAELAHWLPNAPDASTSRNFVFPLFWGIASI